MPQDFVTITTYPYPHDAELVALRARLDAAQLDYYVMDHHTLSIVPFDTQALGGVKVRVRQDQTGRAGALLRELQAERPRPIEPLDAEDAAWMAERTEQLQVREHYARRFLQALKLGAGLLAGGLLLQWVL
jgi:hypothetical protein